MSRKLRPDGRTRRPRSDAGRGRSFRLRLPRLPIALAASTAVLWRVLAPLGMFAAAQTMRQRTQIGFAVHPGWFPRADPLSHGAVFLPGPFVPFRPSVDRRVAFFGHGLIASLFASLTDPAFPYHSFSRTYYDRCYRPSSHPACP
jgi:hypothetical protein